MTLKQDQASWLYRFSGGLVPLVLDQPQDGDADDVIEAILLRNVRAKAVAEFRLIHSKEMADELALKRVMLDNAAQMLENQKDRMRQAFKMTATDGGKKVKSQDKRGDQTKELDTRDVKHDTQIEGDLGGAAAIMALIAEERTKLSNAQVNRSHFDETTFKITVAREDLFTDEEVMKEFFTPLVRDLAIPENLVPPRFSKTQKMIEGSNDPYINECRERGKDLDSGGFEFAKGMVNVAAQACTAAFGANTDASAIAKGTAALLSVGIDGAKKAVNRELTIADWKTIAGGIAGPIGDIVGGAKGDVYGGALIGDSIASAVAGADIVVRVAAWKKSGGPFPTAEIIGSIGDAVSKALAAKSDVSSGKEAVDFGNASALSAEAAAIAKATFIAAAKADAAGLGEALADGDWKKAKRLFRDYALEAGVAAVAEVGKAVINVHVVDRLDQAQSDATAAAQKTLDDSIARGASAEQIQADRDAVDSAAPTFETLAKTINIGARQTDAIDAAQDKLQNLAEIRKKTRDEQLQALRKKYDKEEEAEELQSVEADLAREREEYQKSLNRLSTTEPSDEDFKSIAKLIEKIETDRAIMNAAAAVGGVGAAVAAEFFAPLKAAGSLIRFLVNLHAAVERAIALSKWIDARRGAVSAVSPYSSSIENFVKNQAEQFSHYTIQAALKAIEAGSAIAENGYPPVKALTLAAGATATLEDTIYKFYKQQALVRAWKTTKLSLADTQNRKLALIARRMNPTLAKYTIAYGALIDQDPIAVRAMNSIGLDRETLSRANDQVVLVKRFLQTTYPDDGEVLGKLPPTVKGRKLPIPSLRTRPWMITHAMWTEDMALAGQSPAQITSLLSKVEFYADHASDMRLPDDEAAYFEGRIATLQSLVIEFRSYAPKNKTGQHMPQVQAVLDVYADLAEAEQESVALFSESRMRQPS